MLLLRRDLAKTLQILRFQTDLRDVCRIEPFCKHRAVVVDIIQPQLSIVLVLKRSKQSCNSKINCMKAHFFVIN